MEIDVHHELAKNNAIPRFSTQLVAFFATLAATTLSATTASAFDLQVQHSGPSVVGESHTFTAVPAGASGAVTYEWRFSESADVEPGGAGMAHTFDGPGLYSIS